MGKLTQYQSAALAKLTNEWESAYSLKASIATLDNLVRRGLAEKHLLLGASFPGFERTSTTYRLKPGVSFGIDKGSPDGDHQVETIIKDGRIIYQRVIK